MPMIKEGKKLRYACFFITFCQTCPTSSSTEKNFFSKKMCDNACLNEFILTFVGQLLLLRRENHNLNLSLTKRFPTFPERFSFSYRFDKVFVQHSYTMACIIMSIEYAVAPNARISQENRKKSSNFHLISPSALVIRILMRYFATFDNH